MAMESLGFDTAKLQLLNDRISQAIDAINQVRQSVGLQHTTGVPGFGYGSYGTGIETLLAQQFAQHPLAALMQRPFVGGLGHTTGVPGIGMGGIESLFSQHPFAAQHPLATLAMLRPYVGGIGHTTGVPGMGVPQVGLGMIESLYGQRPFGPQVGWQNPMIGGIGYRPW